MDQEKLNSKPPLNSTKIIKKKGKNIRIFGKRLIVSAAVLTTLATVLGLFGPLTNAITFFEKIGDEVKQAFKSDPPTPTCFTTMPTINNVTTSKWIGAKVESVTEQKYQKYCSNTKIIQTDQNLSEFINVKNVDQDLSSISRNSKNNSMDFTAHLKRAEKRKQPLCLEVYGIRNYKESDFKNIIQINFWKSKKNYEKLSAEERNSECENHRSDPGIIVVTTF
jgi:hypothetical protein